MDKIQALLQDQVEFIKAAIRNPLEVSTVFPTSRWLANTLLSHGDLANAENVVELGAGTGAITQHLEPLLTKRDGYLGIELDAKMVEFLRKRYPDLRFEVGLAEELPQWAQPESVDLVASSLPWSVFNDETQLKTLQAIHDSLKPGGVFVTYICFNALWYPSARAFIERLQSKFSAVDRSLLEWRNIPPAYVFRARK